MHLLRTMITTILSLSLLSAVATTRGQSQTLPTWPLSIPFEFENNQIFLEVGVNGGKPMWFILDSGASGCVVDTGLARRFGIRNRGAAKGTGAGKGAVELTFADGVQYGLGEWAFVVPTSYLIDLRAQKALQGREVAGILGYDFFARAVVEIDFEARVLTLRDPTVPPEANGATIVAFNLIKKTPHIAVRVKVEGHEPVEQDLLVDSGSGDAVDVDALAQSSKRLEVLGGVGLGSEFRMTMARGEWADIGPFRLAAPIGATGGVQLIGLEVLRRFDIVFDYTRSRLLLKPNRFFAEPFRYDASGLALRWAEDMRSFVVHDVQASSPASESGLKSGDRILAINNRPAKDFSIEQANALLTNEPRTILLLVRVLEGDKQITLRLRKQL